VFLPNAGSPKEARTQEKNRFHVVRLFDGFGVKAPFMANGGSVDRPVSSYKVTTYAAVRRERVRYLLLPNPLRKAVLLLPRGVNRF
jgi:hypothetical protein